MIAHSDVEGDKGIQLVSLFAAAVIENPPISNRRKPYSNQTLVSAFKKCVDMIRARFVGQEPVADRAAFLDPKEIDVLCKRIRDGHNRTMMQGEKESELYKSCFPIPREHSHRTRLLPEHDFQTPRLQQLSRCFDMLSISQNLFREGRFTELLKILLTFKAVGRGGEVKFLTYDKMYFDTTFNCILTQWFQRKTLKTTPMAFTADFFRPETCVFLSLGCFWACENGLHRDVPGVPGTAAARTSAYVFQDLQQIRDDSVATQLTAILRSLLVLELKLFFSVKSLRAGAISDLSWDPMVAYEECVAIGGWHSETNKDWYTWVYVCAVIPPCLALAGYPDPRTIPYLPNYACLFMLSAEERPTVASWVGFLSELFPCNIPQFSFPHGRLRSLMDTVGAVMVMRFTHFYRAYGHEHRYCRAMTGAIRRSGMRPTLNGAITILHKWSKTIKDDWTKNNVSLESVGARSSLLSRPSIRDELAKVNSNIARVLSYHADVQAQMQINQVNYENMASQVSTLLNATQQVQEQQQRILQMMQSQPPTPAAPVAPITPANEPLAAGTNNLRVETETAPPAHPPQPPPPPPQQPPARRVNATSQLLRTPASQQQNRIGGTRGKQDSQETISAIFNYIYKHGSEYRGGPFFALRHQATKDLASQTTWILNHIFAGDSKAKSKVKHALMFIDCVWSLEERDEIINMSRNYTDACRLHADLGKKVKNTLHILLPGNRKKTPSRQMKTALLGIANNILKLDFLDVKNGDLLNYTPNWNNGGAVTMPRTILELAELRRLELGHN